MSDTPYARDEASSDHLLSERLQTQDRTDLIGFSTFEWPGEAVVHGADGTVLHITEAVFKF